MLALGACTGQLTGGDGPRVGAPSPAGGDRVVVRGADSDRMRSEPDTRGRVATGTRQKQDRKDDEDRASDSKGNTPDDDRKRPGDDADGDAGVPGSDERDGGAEADGGAADDGGAPDGDPVPCPAARYGDRACERGSSQRGRAQPREHSNHDHGATGDRAR